MLAGPFFFVAKKETLPAIPSVIMARWTAPLISLMLIKKKKMCLAN